MIEQFTPTDLQAQLALPAPPVVLDVREASELERAALPGVVHIPMREIPHRLEELEPDQPIVVLCHHGVRSMSVAQFLVERDFDAVGNLKGGIDAWSREIGGVPRY